MNKQKNYSVLTEEEFAKKGTQQNATLVQVSFPNQEFNPIYLDVSILYENKSIEERLEKDDNSITMYIKELGYSFDNLLISWFIPKHVQNEN